MTSTNCNQLSVVIPVGPMAHKLHALEQVLAECERLPIQIILVCDDYQDGTKEQLEELVDKLEVKPKLIIGNFGGPGSARNEGLKFASEEWVAFWDADDYPNPKLALQTISEGLTNNYDIVCNQYSVAQAQNPVDAIYKSFNRESEAENLKAVGTQPGIWRFIFCRRFTEGVHFSNSRMGEDQVFLARVLSRNPNIDFTSTTTYTYFISRDGQLTGSNKNVNELIGTSKALIKEYGSTPTRFREAIGLMYCQMAISMILKGSTSTKIHGIVNLITHINLSLTSFNVILFERKIRSAKM